MWCMNVVRMLNLFIKVKMIFLLYFQWVECGVCVCMLLSFRFSFIMCNLTFLLMAFLPSFLFSPHTMNIVFCWNTVWTCISYVFHIRFVDSSNFSISIVDVWLCAICYLNTHIYDCGHVNVNVNRIVYYIQNSVPVIYFVAEYNRTTLYHNPVVISMCVSFCVNITWAWWIFGGGQMT